VKVKTKSNGNSKATAKALTAEGAGFSRELTRKSANKNLTTEARRRGEQQTLPLITLI